MKKEFELIGEEWSKMNLRLREACISYLTEFLAKMNGEIALENNAYVTIAYNGGNHPEYASDMNVRVECIRIERGSVKIDLENGCECEIDDVLTSDLYTMCYTIRHEIDNYTQID